jgi:hypothetical protein
MDTPTNNIARSVLSANSETKLPGQRAKIDIHDFDFSNFRSVAHAMEEPHYSLQLQPDSVVLHVNSGGENSSLCVRCIER